MMLAILSVPTGRDSAIAVARCSVTFFVVATVARATGTF